MEQSNLTKLETVTLQVFNSIFEQYKHSEVTTCIEKSIIAAKAIIAGCNETEVINEKPKNLQKYLKMIEDGNKQASHYELTGSPNMAQFYRGQVQALQTVYKIETGKDANS